MTEGEGVRVEMTRFASDGGVRLSLSNVGRPGKKKWCRYIRPQNSSAFGRTINQL
jgi:hypothetical protein